MSTCGGVGSLVDRTGTGAPCVRLRDPLGRLCRIGTLWWSTAGRRWTAAPTTSQSLGAPLEAEQPSGRAREIERGLHTAGDGGPHLSSAAPDLPITFDEVLVITTVS